MLTAACGSHTTVPVPADGTIVRAAPPAEGMPRQYVLKAMVYRTNVPCPDRVAISLNSARDAVQSFPAPADVSSESAPLALADGWWLDRRGLGPNPAFIDMSYEQYSRLKEPPSTARLMRMILPDVSVTEVRRLDMTPQQAAADTAAVNAIIRTWK